MQVLYVETKKLLPVELVISVDGKQLKGWNKKRLKWLRSCRRRCCWMEETHSEILNTKEVVVNKFKYCFHEYLFSLYYYFYYS